MQITKVRRGSMVLTCVFFVSIFMLIMLMQWRSQEALQSIIIPRTQYIQKEYAVQALLEYGVELCAKQYMTIAKAITQHASPLLVTFSRWPLGNERYMTGTLEIAYNESFSIIATLTEQDSRHIAISCRLEKQTVDLQDIYTISGWKKNEIRHGT